MSELRTIPAPLLLEVRTEHFVDVMLCLQDAGFSVTARADMPNRHIVEDDLRRFERGVTG